MDSNEMWEIDLSKWTMADQDDYGRALKLVETEYVNAPVYLICARVIKRWPYPFDPSKPDEYTKLNVKQFKEVHRRVYEAVFSLRED
jgi:hypothetical protein